LSLLSTYMLFFFRYPIADKIWEEQLFLLLNINAVLKFQLRPETE